MADQALCEGYRVLKDTGIIYLSVKRGEGLQMVDTREGLGKILHQFHTMESIAGLLTRNHFRIVESWTKPSSRGKHIVWICAMAEKM
jgi:DNA modification methylase